MTKRIIKIIIIAGIIAILTFSFKIENPFNKNKTENTTTEDTRKTEKIIRKITKTIKKDETLDLSKKNFNIMFSTTGTIEANNTINISPQINGEITDINVKIGDKVEKNTLLISLGNSLNTDLNQAQQENAEKNLKLTEQSKLLSQSAGNQTIQAAQIATNTAFLAYQNANTNKNNTIDAHNEQIKNAEIALNNAKLGAENANKAVDIAAESYKLANKNYRDAKKLDDPTINLSTLSSQKNIAASQVDSAKIAEDMAENTKDQARLTIKQLEDGYQAQLDQLNFAIASANNQYLLAQNQLASAKIGSQQQILGTENQITQAKSAIEIAKIKEKYLKIVSPITGTISSIDTKIGELVSPGKTLIKIEQTNSILVKTSINEKEAELINIGDKTNIIINKTTIEGTITSISPNLNPATQKIEIEITIENKTNLKTGNNTTVIFKAKNNNKIYIPINSIFIKDEEKNIKIINSKNLIEYKTIVVGNIFNDQIEVLNGLNGNETIITTSTTFLEEGDKIEIE